MKRFFYITIFILLFLTNYSLAKEFILSATEVENSLVISVQEQGQVVDFNEKIPFKLNQINKEVSFMHGKAVLVSPLPSHLFLILSCEAQEIKMDQFYYVVHLPFYKNIFSFPYWVIWLLPLGLIGLYIFFKRLIILALIGILLFLYYTGDLSLPFSW